MDRVFLDSNVLFSTAWRRDSKFRRLWKVKNIVLLTSSYVLTEVLRNLEKPRQINDLEKLVRKMAVVEATQAPPPRGIKLPAKDMPILADAISGGTTHLLTGDIAHFGAWYGKTMAGIRVLPPAEYLRSRKISLT